MNKPQEDLPTAGSTVYVPAPPERVWELVTDIHLIASLSREVQEVTLLDGAGCAAAGVRFRARNANPAVGEWESVSQVVEFDPPRRFTWAVMDPANPAATWAFELAPRDGGTEVTQRVRIGPGPTMLDRLIRARPDDAEAIVGDRVRSLQAGIDANLAALGEMALKNTALKNTALKNTALKNTALEAAPGETP